MGRVSSAVAAVALLATAGLVVGSAAEASRGGGGKEPVAVVVPDWLVLGPAPVPLPLFAEESPGRFGMAQVQQQSLLGWVGVLPGVGQEAPWPGVEPLTWRQVQAGRNGLVSIKAAEAKTPQAGWMAVQLEVSRWVEGELELLGNHLRRAWIGGEAVAAGGGGSESGAVTGKVKLAPGSHLLLLQSVHDRDRSADWSLGAAFTPARSEFAGAVTFSLEPVRDLELRDVLDHPEFSSLAVSPAGDLVAYAVRRVHPDSSAVENWVEIRSTRDGAPRWSWRGAGNLSHLAWAPTGRRLSFTSRDSGNKEESRTLWVADLAAGTVLPALERVKDLSGYRWLPDGRTVVYWVSERPEGDPRGFKRLEGLRDRQRTARHRQVLFLAAVPEGTVRPLAAGPHSARVADVTPAGDRILLLRSFEDLTERPYSRTEAWEVETATGEARKLRDFLWLGSLQYAPNGRDILVVSGPSEFGSAGLAVPKGVLPNEGDGQLYLWNPDTDSVTALSREFNPDIREAHWHRGDGHVYLRATDRDEVSLFRYNPEDRSFSRLEKGFAVADEMAFAERAPVAVARGTSPWQPATLTALDLVGGGLRVLAQPAAAALARVRRGEVREFDAEIGEGEVIPGRVYLPPEFDPERRYPAIVYYYAGTNPVTRDFGGRYPKEWWAARGYVVYIPQPSGAVGFGQEWSARHVNEWGALVVDEIIAAARVFVEAHPFVDGSRLGCIGASYGGFTTKLLITRTDMFAAAVSHAGISSISSYWGEGWWGYGYNARSAAGSFPWNNRELYVERSALFHADAVTTPVLLTHGTDDTNVPVGESDAFYTALKLLGRTVEYIQISNADHTILDHAQRLVWSPTILAWFDRWLKDQPEWWNALYPDRAAEEKK